MKLIAPAGSRLIVTWDADKISPKTGGNLHLLFQTVQARYGFIGAPNSFQAQQTLAQAQIAARSVAAPFTPPIVNFVGGQLAVNGVIHSINQLDFTLGAPNIVVSCQTSDSCDLVFDDVIGVLEKTLRYRDIKENSCRRYASALTVEFEHGFGQHFEQIRRIETIINRMAAETGVPENYQFERLAFAHDPSTVFHDSILAETGVVIERRAARPYEENRYTCVGPFKTDKLAELLQEIEREIV